jgi:Domain of unknown function (DUF1905)
MRARAETRSSSPMRFGAVIRREGVNWRVEIPARVSRAFDKRRNAGRIRVAGRLNGAWFNGTLMPSAGCDVLFVNGGMRAAAGVAAGDRVTFELNAVAGNRVAIPTDLSAALAGGSGASRAFRSLTPSRQRELVPTHECRTARRATVTVDPRGLPRG